MPMVRSRYLDAGRVVSPRRLAWPWRSHTQALSLTLKHAADRLVAAVGLVFTAPLIALAMLALRRAGERPALRRDELLGEDGRMIAVLSLAISERLRRTRPLWRTLERAGVGALPQLWNVLRGDLSLVGPRPRALDLPPPPERPGLTGLAQVEQLKRPLALGERLDLDDDYALRWSLALDVRICAVTMWRVIRR
jgi:lipopolysaccharide/colanic/teichoic acid biosynthesis glycosyltransferase